MAADDLIREAQDPTTSAARLAELVQADPATWSVVAAHPAAYPGLLQWLSERGDAATNAALAARASAPAATEVLPTAPPAETETPVVETPVAETPVVETPTVEAPAAPVTPDEPTVVAPAVTPTETFGQAVAAESPAPAGPAEPTYAAPTATGTEPNKRNFWVLAGMVAVVLVLIGGVAFGATKVFGGGDDKDEATSSKTDAPASTPSDDPTEDAPTADTPDTDEPSNGGDDSGDSDDFCEAMEAIQKVSLDAMPSGGGTTGPEDLQGMVGKMTKAYNDLADAAPAELDSEIKVMTDFLDVLADPTGAAAKEFTENMEKYTEAVTKVSTYYAKNCS